MLTAAYMDRICKGEAVPTPSYYQLYTLEVTIGVFAHVDHTQLALPQRDSHDQELHDNTGATVTTHYITVGTTTRLNNTA